MSIDPSPHNQVALRGREMSIDTKIPAQDELTTISNIFQGQWLLFVNAKESGIYRLMRIALNQAISTQDMLTNLFGTQGMLEVSDGWLARDELARMEHMFQIPPQPLPQPVEEQPAARTPSQVANRDTMPPRPTQPLRLSPPVLPAQQQPLQRAPPPPPPLPQTYGAHPRATLSLSGRCTAAGPRADDTWYGTPTGYLPTRSAASVPPFPVPGAGGLLRPGSLLLPVAASSPCALPLPAAISTRQPVPPPIPEEPPLCGPHDSDAPGGQLLHESGKNDQPLSTPQRQRRNGSPSLPSTKQQSIKSGH
ncbi:hypothetical protein PCASD_10748 [Puccinia coronata f. sp. avenae]|uniref:Uncharacterized protein n=1 Tax=Puccinia coronata f. sp. avenae TaxID=200324 RepID=A0A2N5UT05_9BASI|nr:hypothetical protein PCASD_10748 [Puccinia coronata f. sp. avenae]